MSVASRLLAPVKMRYSSNPFRCLTLSDFKYARCPKFSIFRTGCVLFYLFHHIQSSGDINFEDITPEKRRRGEKNKRYICNKQRNELATFFFFFANQTHGHAKANAFSLTRFARYWLNIKKNIYKCARRTTSPYLV